MKKTISFCLFTIMFQTGFGQQIQFKNYSLCSFSVSLPANMTLRKMDEDSSPDYCDYEVRTKSGILIELHSMTKQRMETDDLNDLYKEAIAHIDMDISYKTILKDFFVISGIDNRTNRIVYWKRVVGEQFVSDLRIEYDKSNKSAIERYIGKISSSFRCD